ncbi:Kelch-like protein 20 [Zostera marina]|uniref:Kelch-like protein 20 n=1 Tax=Zostera marina TaxID=29655 RepID=A0A0K9NU20_ZOSMR|nr:Kelch-like protein 20 [Zostera marina]
MAKYGGKNHQKWSSGRTYLILIACVLLVGIVFVTDLFFASSSSTVIYSSTPASLSNSQLPSVNILPVTDVGGGSVVKREDLSVVGKDLNATYADLPVPMLEWEEMPEAPVVRLDGAAIQIGELLYVFAGYGSIDLVYSHVDVYNFTSNTWGGRFDMPKEMAHSHLGMVTDGRYIYVISGQYGPQCRSSISRCFVLDTKTKEWHDLLSLPVPRYAPATQLWRGRLHVMGGSKEDRYQMGLEHWSLAVKDGKALETEWRPEIPIPRGGPHRACVVANDKLFVIGGQEGDFMAKPGSPIFKCSRKEEVVYGDVYMLDGDGKQWKELAPMPKPESHIEFAWQIVNNSIIIVGGTTDKHPVTKRMILIGEVIRFNLDTMEWSVIGRMPFRVKTTLVGYWKGWLYFTSGQRDKGPNDPAPKKLIGATYRTRLHL